MLKTNEHNLVEFLLQCQPGQPKTRGNWEVDHQGTPFLLPSIGGITLNVQVGDSAFGWQGDHIEPGVSCTADTQKPYEHPNVAVQIYSCAGNMATVVTGEAKGAIGRVIGHHGGSEHVIVDFERDIKEKLLYTDTIIIRGKGQGMKLTDYPEIKLFNLDPALLAVMKIRELEGGVLEVPVSTIVPAFCMGSGIGSAHVAKGDYDIMTSDLETIKEYGIDKIRLGDFVALQDHDNRYGRAYRKGAVTIGIVVHSNCLEAGHGPGVTTLMTAASALIRPVIDPKANLADLLGIGTALKERG
jgi:Domain of unknown function (DUF4438)